MGVKLFGGTAHWGCPLYPDCLYYILYGPMGSKKWRWNFGEFYFRFGVTGYWNGASL